MAAGASRVQWTEGKLKLTELSPADDIQFRSVSVDASKVAETLGVEADVKPGATVQKITAIHYVVEGRTESKQLWDMGSFAFALAGDRWHCQRKANEAVRNDPDLKKYDSRIIIETKQLEVILVNFLYQSILFVRRS